MSYSQSGNIVPSAPVSALDTINQFWSLEGDAGLQRKLFSDIAKNNPNAFGCFSEIIANNTNKTLRALAIQSIGQIPPRNQPNYQQDSLKSFYIRLFAELRSSSDLMKWSASKVVSDTVPPIILEARQLWGSSEPIDRSELSRSIRQMQNAYKRRINEFTVDRRGERGDDPEYEKYLEYWVYCDTETLFIDEVSSPNYRPIVEHTLARLQAHGVIYALGCQGGYTTNKTAQDAALRQARQIYNTEDNQKILFDHLAWYIDKSTHSDGLRVNAAEILDTTDNWKPALDKLKIISKLLLQDKVLRDGAIKILSSQKILLQKNLVDATNLLESFVFLQGYQLKRTDANLNKLSLKNIENLENIARKDRSSIDTNTTKGKQSAANLSKQLNFSDAYAKQHIEALQSQHTSQIDGWLKQLDETRTELRRLQSIITSNQAALNQACRDSCNLDSNTCNKINSIADIGAKDSKNFDTIEECQNLITRLNKLRDELIGCLSLPIIRNSALSREPDKLRKQGLISFGFAAAFVILAAISKPSKAWLLQNPVPPPGASGNYSSNSISNTQNSLNSSWYNTGFPKPNGCGGGTPINGQWYPVFVKYSASNWQGIIRNHCGDIDQAQSESIAREKGQIQIASFGSRQDAEGFAAYMKSQYGSGWVGKN